MKPLLTLVAGIVLTAGAYGGGTVTFSLSSPSDGSTVTGGTLIEWTITVSVSSADNLGLALAAVDLIQDPANSALPDLPAGTCPGDMADFDRPAGISNPGPGGVGSAYGGTPLGPDGAKDLRQLGGAMNTFGVPGDGIGLDYDVRAGVGQAAPQILASGSFLAPSEAGLYAFYLENAIANTLDDIAAPPDFSPVSAATAVIGVGQMTFSVVCRGDCNCDGRVTFADIDPFVEALGGESAWNQHHPDCPWLNADCNGDGRVTFADIDPFVARIGTTCP